MTGRTETIKLGGVDYVVGPMTLGQMRVIGVGTARWRLSKGQYKDDPVAAEQNWYQGTIEMVAAALGKSQQDVNQLVGITLQELLEANAAIIRVSGLEPEKKVDDGYPKMGEDQGAKETING